jgi:hypothetical protein
MKKAAPRPSALRASSSRRRTTACISRIMLLVFLLFGGERSLRADDAEWTVLLEPMYMDAYGHDQHVLTIQEINLDSTLTEISQTPVTLETEERVGFRFELQYVRGDWGLGLDFFWFNTSQGRPSRTAAASGPAGAVDEVTFQAAGRSFTSGDPGEVLFFNVIEDTDIATWTVDLYALKTMTETPAGSVQLQFGLRNADFDNDYHSAAGIQNVAGSLFDASSNYGRMIGPLVGVIGDVHFGKHSIRRISVNPWSSAPQSPSATRPATSSGRSVPRRRSRRGSSSARSKTSPFRSRSSGSVGCTRSVSASASDCPPTPRSGGMCRFRPA